MGSAALFGVLGGGSAPRLLDIHLELQLTAQFPPQELFVTQLMLI
eukprot:gene27984-34774_t